MKKITNFINTASFWKIFIAGFILTTTFVFLLSQLLDYLVGCKLMSFSQVMRFSIFLGIIFGLMIALINTELRESDNFWAAASTLELKVKNTEDRNILNTLYDVDYIELIELARCVPHYSEVKRIRAIIETKLLYVK